MLHSVDIHRVVVGGVDTVIPTGGTRDYAVVTTSSSLNNKKLTVS